MRGVWVRITDHVQIPPGKRSGLAHPTHSPGLSYNVVNETNSKTITMSTSKYIKNYIIQNDKVFELYL